MPRYDNNLMISLVPPARLGRRDHDDTVQRLARCATAADVRAQFANVRAIVAPALGAASQGGATKPVVKAFARLLQHPLGVSVAAEALGLAVCARGLVYPTAFEELFDLAGRAHTCMAPIEFPLRSRFTARLRGLPTHRQRGAELLTWWRLTHFADEPWTPETIARTLLGSGAAAISDGELAAHLEALPPAVSKALASCGRVFQDLSKVRLLRHLCTVAPAELRSNPACPPGMRRLFDTAPILGPASSAHSASNQGRARVRAREFLVPPSMFDSMAEPEPVETGEYDECGWFVGERWNDDDDYDDYYDDDGGDVSCSIRFDDGLELPVNPDPVNRSDATAVLLPGWSRPDSEMP